MNGAQWHQQYGIYFTPTNTMCMRGLIWLLLTSLWDLIYPTYTNNMGFILTHWHQRWGLFCSRWHQRWDLFHFDFLFIVLWGPILSETEKHRRKGVAQQVICCEATSTLFGHSWFFYFTSQAGVLLARTFKTSQWTISKCWQLAYIYMELLQLHHFMCPVWRCHFLS